MTVAAMEISPRPAIHKREAPASATRRGWAARPLGLTSHLLRDIGLADVAPGRRRDDGPGLPIGFGAPRL